MGGDVVYVAGNMVSRHAFRGAGTRWIRLDTGTVADLALLPEATPTKMRAGVNDLVVVRVGDTVRALHDVCAHAGGPLHEGRVVDDCIECPWHASRFRLTDGLARQGPTVYDQPAYEIRAAEAGGYEVRRMPSALSGRPRGIIAGMVAIVVPDPSLVVLIGAAGAGKSTLAARLFAADEIVSSDALRALISGDEADQRVSGVAFRILHRTVGRRLALGQLTVVDATNTDATVRRPLIARARAAGLPVTAIVLDIERSTVARQNAGRSRVVDDEVIDRHLAAVRRTVDGDVLGSEGFDQVVVLRSPRRRPSRCRSTGELPSAQADQRDGRRGQADADGVVAGDRLAQDGRGEDDRRDRVHRRQH